MLCYLKKNSRLQINLKKLKTCYLVMGLKTDFDKFDIFLRMIFILHLKSHESKQYKNAFFNRTFIQWWNYDILSITKINLVWWEYHTEYNLKIKLTNWKSIYMTFSKKTNLEKIALFR